MKKIYFAFSGILLFFAINLNAQQLVTDGDMEWADSWTIVDLAAGDGHTEEFDYTLDTPKDGEGGCLSLSGNGGWANVAVCQELTVTKGVEYIISMEVKTSIDLAPQNVWVEIVVVPEMPVDDGDITAWPNVFTLNSWDCSDVTFVDGNFADHNCDNKSPLNDTIFYPGTGDTTVVLVLKAGGGAPYNILLDNVSVLGPEGPSSVENAVNPVYNRIYPNPAREKINISDVNATEITIFDVVGKRVYSTSDINNRMTIDISGLADGLYVIRAGDSARSFIKE